MHETNFINGIRLEAFKGNVGELLSIGTDGVVCISASIQSITGNINSRLISVENTYATKAYPISGIYNNVVVNSQGIVISGGNINYGGTVDLTPYTLLTTTQNISAGLSTRIGTLETNTFGITGGLTQLDLRYSYSDGYQGRQSCNSNDTLYTIDHPTVDITKEFPVVSLDIPISGSEIFVQGIYDRRSTSFKVELSGIPTSGYGILWHVSTTNKSIDISNYTPLTTTQAISGNLQTQINQIVQEGTTISSSGGSILVNKNGLSFNLEVASAPVSNHNSLLGLQGNGTDYYHLNSSQFASISGGINLSAYTPLTTTSSISGNLNNRIVTLETSTSGITGGLTQLDTRYSGSNFVHLTENESISGNKTFVNQISNPKGFNGEGFGYLTLASVTIDGINNVAFGYGALQRLTSGSTNTAFGYHTLNKLTTGRENIAIGHQALINVTTSNDNVAIGKSSMYTNTDGSANTAVGNGTLQSNTNGYYNCAFGRESLGSNDGGSQNTGYGFQSLGGNSSASNNTGVGYRVLYGISTGGNNTAIGFEAGYNSSVAAATNCVFIGYQSKPIVDSITNSIAIGSTTSISASNQVVLGNSNITITKLNGVVTINDDNASVFVTLSSAPTPTTTRVKGNYGYYGGYLYRWIDNSVVVRSLVETSW